MIKQKDQLINDSGRSAMWEDKMSSKFAWMDFKNAR